MWSYIIDGLLIGIIVVCAIVGIAKGLFDSVLGLVSTGLALAVSIFTAKYVADFINKIFNFEDFILGKLDGMGESFTIFGATFDNVEVAKFIVWICSIVIVFLIIKLAIFILAKIFASVTKNSPTISGINRVLGMVFGLAKGVVVVAGCLAILSLLSQISVVGKPIQDALNTTTIAKPAYNYVDDLLEKTLDKDTIQDIVDRIISDNIPAEKPADGEGESGEESAGALEAQRPTNNVETQELTYTL